VCPHVEWAIARVLSAPVRLEWAVQPVEPAARRAEYTWSGRPGTSGELAAALRQWSMLRFEVTEEPSAGVDGERFCFAPGLGLWHGRTSANGDIVVGEDQLRALVAKIRSGEALAHQLDELLAAGWDEALEPYRHAGDGAPVTWLHQVG